MEFDYPLTPTTPIEDGHKTIAFNPPVGFLSGEQVHQWVGARGGTDLHRRERQKVVLRRMLEQRFDFGRALADPDAYALSDPAALDELRQVRPGWAMETLGGLTPETINGKQVLVRG